MSPVVKLLRVLLVFLAIGLCFLMGPVSSEELNVTASVVSIIRSDTSLLVPNRYAYSGRISLQEVGGYRVVLSNVSRPLWLFNVGVTGGGAATASFDNSNWTVHTYRSITNEARSGLLTLVPN